MKKIVMLIFIIINIFSFGATDDALSLIKGNVEMSTLNSNEYMISDIYEFNNKDLIVGIWNFKTGGNTVIAEYDKNGKIKNTYTALTAKSFVLKKKNDGLKVINQYDFKTLIKARKVKEKKQINWTKEQNEFIKKYGDELYKKGYRVGFNGVWEHKETGEKIKDIEDYKKLGKKDKKSIQPKKNYGKEQYKDLKDLSLKEIRERGYIIGIDGKIRDEVTGELIQ